MTKSAKLPYALNVSGHIVSVKDVPNGLACDCTCPACGARLVAKQGAEQVWHFSHYHVESCQAGYESALHLAVKAIIEQDRLLFLPRCFVVRYNNDHDHSPYLTDKHASRSGVYEYLADDNDVERARDLAADYARGIAERMGRTIEFDRVEVEVPDGSIRPDLVAFASGRPINIEVAVTHFIDQEKLVRIRARGVPTIEIVVPPLTDPDWKTLRDLIRGGQATFWKYHPLVEKKADADYHARMEEKAKRIEAIQRERERRSAQEGEFYRRESLRKARAKELRETKYKLIAEAHLNRRRDRFHVRWNKSNVNLSVFPYTDDGAKEVIRIAIRMRGSFNRQMRQWEFPAERTIFIQLVTSLRSAGARLSKYDVPEDVRDDTAFLPSAAEDAEQASVPSAQVTRHDCAEDDATLCAIVYRRGRYDVVIRLGLERLFVQVIPDHPDSSLIRLVKALCAGNEGDYDPRRVVQFEFPSDDELFFRLAGALKVQPEHITKLIPPKGLTTVEFLQEIATALVRQTLSSDLF